MSEASTLDVGINSQNHINGIKACRSKSTSGRCLIRSRNCLPFTSTWFHSQFSMWSATYCPSGFLISLEITSSFIYLLDKVSVNTCRSVTAAEYKLKLCLPPLWWGDILFLSCPSVRHTVCQCNSSETTEQNFMTLCR